MSYRTGPKINWDEIVPEDGEVIVTPTEPGKALVSIGRRAARGGVKHLGILSVIEAQTVIEALEEHFGISAKAA